MPRARRVEVEHAGVDGSVVITVFTDALARLVAHEIDHLHGVVYTVSGGSDLSGLSNGEIEVAHHYLNE
ncbi:polypeptide deformylase [Murinocardiopsis flavida]|uniref:Polypeptide deformylase n=1 Tax=Murinocardiopsis flavida TaxID=645275 RepID=A0A2P8DI34_9ACTN|nr:peptide deformylase [Murinocardiopsis flavida]PSK96875.1 polypeptide deformylase [Murinocardiopsis flavida]